MNSPVRPCAPSQPRHSLELRYAFKDNDLIMKKYRVRRSLGRGGFGTVVLAVDDITDTAVAIKLLHKDADLNEDVRQEEKVYRALLAGCDPRIYLFAEVISSGTHHGFHCIVFELCGATLYDIVNGHLSLLPFPARHILEVAYQLVNAVGYLHSLGIIHADLKLDNIAVRDQTTTTIRWLNPLTGFEDKKILVTTQICVLDLGTAVTASSSPSSLHSGRVGIRSYRSPEVTLGLPWKFGVDVFAVGCMIAEVYLGNYLFSGDISSDREHLAALDRVLGPFSRVFARTVEAHFPGTFDLDDNEVRVIYPSLDTVPTRDTHSAPMLRLENLQPLSVDVHNIELVGCIGSWHSTQLNVLHLRLQ
uniref:Protein kinase domain-containing protein n=1 Tax=Ganoderma boninense TaxID=34458 RepID=A0A5K1JXK3_9APHY|nr:Protein kinase domain-containing protein [Ganoderma boninense]